MLNKIWDYRMKSHHQAAALLSRIPLQKSTLSDYLQPNDLEDRERCIYIHIPFCSRTCSFCNLQRSSQVPSSSYTDLILRQIHQMQSIPTIRDGEYQSVYFGGGTPTVLDTEDLRKILRGIHDHFRLSPQAEISIETSLTDLTDEKLTMLCDEGVNRFSIGIQTLSDRGRKLLGRRGTGNEAVRHLENIIASGFDNTNIDLIYSYPEQTQAEIEADIARLLSINIAGLSYYSLMIGGKSALAQRRGLTEETYARFTLERDYEYWNHIYTELCASGFKMLELTKFVRPNRDDYRYIHIRKNNGDTLPLGAGAGGRIGNLLLHIPANTGLYEEMLGQPYASQYTGRIADDIYNEISRQIAMIQFGYLERDEIFPGTKEAFAEICAFVFENELGVLRNERLELNGKGIFWGNNLANQYAGILMKNLLRSE